MSSSPTSAMKANWVTWPSHSSSPQPISTEFLFSPEQLAATSNKTPGARQIPREYWDLSEVFSETECDILPPHHETDLHNLYPLPLMKDMLSHLAKGKIFTKLDLREAYYRGASNSKPCLSDYREPRQCSLRQVVQKLLAANLYVKLLKCEFHHAQLDYLVYRVSNEGIEMDPAKVQAVLGWQAPGTHRQLQSFLGFANFYWLFIPSFMRIAKPMMDLLKTGMGPNLPKNTLTLNNPLSFKQTPVMCQ
ncbi:putative mitochondrial protein, partial [Ophiophagus hannah]